MIKTYNWVPDTHPTVSIELSIDTDFPDNKPVALWAKIDNILADNPQEIYDTIIAENNLKNKAEAFLISILPDEFLRQEMDNDLDLIWLDSSGNKWYSFGSDYMNEYGILGSTVYLDVESLIPSMIIKTKHTPKWEFGLVDRIISFEVPGASIDLKNFLNQEMFNTFGDLVEVK